MTVDHDSLAVGTSDGAIRVWRASAACPHLFDLNCMGSLDQAVTAVSSPDRWWGHGGPVSCLAVEEGRLYSGSWDMTAKVRRSKVQLTVVFSTARSQTQSEGGQLRGFVVSEASQVADRTDKLICCGRGRPRASHWRHCAFMLSVVDKGCRETPSALGCEVVMPVM